MESQSIDLMMNEDEARKMDKLRILIGETSKSRKKEESETLSVYLDLARNKILERLYPYRDDYDEMVLPKKYETLELKIAAYLLNKRGAEGEVQHIENGVHRNYGDADIPEAMLAGIAPFVGIPR